MTRRLHTWKIRNRELALGDRTLIMGVLNVTPDSFSDGGEFLDPDRAFAHALEMEEQGADIIDIGAESTRPGAQPISASEELQRLVPVLKRLRDKLSVPISVDTYKADVAERALELGAEIINDPTGFTFDPQLAKPIVEYNAGLILNHMRGRPDTWATLGPMPDVMGQIIKDLDASVNRARRAGVDRLRMVADPGIGFGKRREQNSEIIARLEEMKRLELPITVGPSRKSFLAQGEARETEFATAAAVTASVLAGAHIVRVHDVAAVKAAIAVADEIWRASERVAAGREQPAAQAGASRRQRPQASTPQVEATPTRPAVRPPLLRDFEPRVQKEKNAEVDADSPPAIPPQTESPAPRPSAEDTGHQPFRKREAERPRFERSGSPKPHEDRPRFERSGPPKPRGERPRFERSGPPKPHEERPRFERSGPPRPREDRPRFERSGPPKPRGDRPRFERSGPPKPRGDRPRFERSGPPRPREDRSRFERSGPPKPRGDRPRFERSGPPKPFGDRPPRRDGGKPRFGSSRPSGAQPPRDRKGPPRPFRRPRPNRDE